jgi:UDP-N-acetylmuramoyl-L-alanyl-D-glutamate--2,6-diaminopimelate ligase
MGAIAAQLADRMIITNDNPRDEDPQKIAEQVIAGTESSAHCEIVHDRETAIETAIASAAAEDVVLIAGKGHETVQLIGNASLPFSDVAVVRAVLNCTTNGTTPGRVE